jgi:tetratricopeptide (TPR) repeat protein
MAAAEKSFRIGLGLAETAKTLDALGLTFTFQARDAEAIPLFERATAIRPDMYLYYLHLGMALRRSGRAAAAKQAFDQALRTAELEVVANPRNGFVRAMLAYAALQCGDRRRSEADLAQALHFSPNDNDAQLWAILTYESLGKREDSLRLLSRAGRGLLDEVSRWPDLGALHRDPRFLELQTMSRTKENK